MLCLYWTGPATERGAVRKLRGELLWERRLDPKLMIAKEQKELKLPVGERAGLRAAGVSCLLPGCHQCQSALLSHEPHLSVPVQKLSGLPTT